MITTTPNVRRDGNRAAIPSLGSLETLLTFDQAAEALGISLRQFRRLVDSGKIAFVKVSERAPRVRPSELQRFLEASAVKYSEEAS
jgi:excisionase family DNA binding protein